MKIEIDYKGAGCDMRSALADALNINEERVNVVVTPPAVKIPFRCDWRVVKSCADVVAYIDGEQLLLNIA